jgi:tRNA/rRNA methyltransferase
MHLVDGEHHVSMNLGQAVAVCLYELVRDGASVAVREATGQVAGSTGETVSAGKAAGPSGEPATAAALERVSALLSEVMEATEYKRRHAANSKPAQVRRLVRRIGMDAVDAPVWMGILRQVMWKLGLWPREGSDETRGTEEAKPTTSRRS